MRLQSAALLALLPLLSNASGSRSECIRARSGELARKAACGDTKAVAACLSALGTYFIQSDVETCFLDAGCLPDEASAEAINIYSRCDAPHKFGDLRKRQRQTNPPKDEDQEAEPTNNEEEADEPTTKAPAPKTTAKPQQQTTQTPKNQPTTTAAPATSEEEGGTVIVTATAPPVETTTTTLQCLTTTTIRTTACNLGSNKVNTCSETLLPKETCAEGLLCRLEQGATTCMKIDNSLSAGGIIVAIVFAAAITAAIGFMTFFCCREKSREKKLKARAEAAAIAKASAAGARRQMRMASDRQPLMAGDPAQGYGPIDDGSHRGQDPFHDQHRVGN